MSQVMAASNTMTLSSVNQQSELSKVSLTWSVEGSIMSVDRVIVTVSLGVLKASIHDDDSGMLMFNPPLPSFKVEAI